MKNNMVTIKDIRASLYYENLDSEYLEALSHAIVLLGYVSDSPFNLYFGNNKQKEEIKRIDTMPLDSNQISEIIHLMMYEMRNDFQYGRFKTVADKYIEISKEMKKEKINNNVNLSVEKPKANFNKVYGYMYDVIGVAAKILKENQMYDKSREMIERTTLSYSYYDALNIISEYIEILNEKENESEFEY